MVVVVPIAAALGIAKGFIPALTILGITKWISGPKDMAKYEEEFITDHEHEQDKIIPPGFDEKSRETGLFFQLCAPYISIEDLAEYPLQIELNHIDFKKTVHPAFAAEVVRCNDKYAIIKAPKKDCAYLLRKGNPNPNFNGDGFFFEEKFCYYPKKKLQENEQAPLLDGNAELKLSEDLPKTTPTTLGVPSKSYQSESEYSPIPSSDLSVSVSHISDDKSETKISQGELHKFGNEPEPSTNQPASESALSILSKAGSSQDEQTEIKFTQSSRLSGNKSSAEFNYDNQQQVAVPVSRASDNHSGADFSQNIKLKKSEIRTLVPHKSNDKKSAELHLSESDKSEQSLTLNQKFKDKSEVSFRQSSTNKDSPFSAPSLRNNKYNSYVQRNARQNFQPYLDQYSLIREPVQVAAAA